METPGSSSIEEITSDDNLHVDVDVDADINVDVYIQIDESEDISNTNNQNTGEADLTLETPGSSSFEESDGTEPPESDEIVIEINITTTTDSPQQISSEHDSEDLVRLKVLDLLQNYSIKEGVSINSLWDDDDASKDGDIGEPGLPPYYVPEDDIIIADVIPPEEPEHPLPPPEPESEGIPEASPIDPLPEPPLAPFEKFKKPRVRNFCCLILLLLIIAIVSVLILREKEPDDLPPILPPITSKPSPKASDVPSFSPVSQQLYDETQINIDADKATTNNLMSYEVSISSDGNTLAVAGFQTLHIYSYSSESAGGSWQKVMDSGDLLSNGNTMEDLSWKTMVSLSSNGLHLIVGDEFNPTNGINSGSIMIFSTFRDELPVPWYQVGPSITGFESWDRLGACVAIADSGRRIAVSTSQHGAGYANIYDFDGSDWVVAMNRDDINIFGGSIAMSPNGEFFAIQYTLQNVVDIYELSTFTKLESLMGDDMYDFGHSISFSNDGSTLAISTYAQSKVNLYQFNPLEQRYLPLGRAITAWGIDGLGYSVSVSDDGNYVAVSALSPPERKATDRGKVPDLNYIWWADMLSREGFVFVFHYEDEVWEQIAKFEHNSAHYDQIGWSVSLAENGKVVVFGAFGPGSDPRNDAKKSGQVIVYRNGMST